MTPCQCLSRITRIEKPVRSLQKFVLIHFSLIAFDYLFDKLLANCCQGLQEELVRNIQDTVLPINLFVVVIAWYSIKSIFGNEISLLYLFISVSERYVVCMLYKSAAELMPEEQNVADNG